MHFSIEETKLRVISKRQPVAFSGSAKEKEKEQQNKEVQELMGGKSLGKVAKGVCSPSMANNYKHIT